MVTIAVDFTTLSKEIGRGKKAIANALDSLGCTIEGDRVEINPNRPDLFSTVGVQRALKQYFLMEEYKDYRDRYRSGSSRMECRVDERLRDIRPGIVCCAIKNVELDEKSMNELIELQEMLHLTLGRKRAAAAIGLHDLDAVKPPFYYKMERKERKFIPLGESSEWSLEEILEQNEKGREYGDLIRGFDGYPLLVDSEDNVLSFPPIINGNLTTLSERTKNIFIDITGKNMKVLNDILGIIVTDMADRFPECEIKGIKIVRSSGSFETPNLEPEEEEINIDELRRLIGFRIGEKDIIQALKRMGHRPAVNKNKVQVLTPCYRNDLIHRNDLVEEVAIGYGYEKIKSKMPTTFGFAKENPIEKFSSLIRQMFTGMGFVETVSLSLSSKEEQFSMMNLKEKECVEVLNPISGDTTILKWWVIPSLLSLLNANRHNELPQKIFEIGDVVSKVENTTHLGCAIEDRNADFREIKSISEAFAKSIGLSVEYEKEIHESFIEGRCASMLSKGIRVGIIGELHPQVMNNFSLEAPVVAMEVDLSKLVVRDNEN